MDFWVYIGIGILVSYFFYMFMSLVMELTDEYYYTAEERHKIFEYDEFYETFWDNIDYDKFDYIEEVIIEYWW